MSSLNLKSPLVYLLGIEKVKILKVFLKYPNKKISLEELQTRTNIPVNTLKTELRQAIKYNIIQELKTKKEISYTLNPVEEVLALETVIFRLGNSFFEALAQKLDKIGKIHLCIVMGVFLQRDKDRVDMFLVADEVNEKKFEALIQEIESELAQEIIYTVLTHKEFEYRQNMFDKFVLDILENKNTQIVIDKSSISSDN
ncbi:hypothetical protein EBU71_03630 [bacterium]|nr:hypothetical protein [Candidatus Elulimicrobium humile]